MPNRIIKESICTSETLAKLSAEAERLFFHLIVQCDDFGLMFANPNILKNRCFQLTSDKIKETQMVRWIQELFDAGIIILYRVDGIEYLKLTNWGKHQQRRASNSKYPLPDSDTAILQSNDINCNHMLANVPESRERDKRTRVENESRGRSRNDGKQELAPYVRMTDLEFEKLEAENGVEATQWMIRKLSDYKESKGKTYKSDAAAIRTWVVDAWHDEQKRRGTLKPTEPLPDWLMKGAPIPNDTK